RECRKTTRFCGALVHCRYDGVATEFTLEHVHIFRCMQGYLPSIGKCQIISSQFRQGFDEHESFGILVERAHPWTVVWIIAFVRIVMQILLRSIVDNRYSSASQEKREC